MSDRFFSDPILNSPYEIPALHWELVEGIPTQAIVEDRRRCELIMPIPSPSRIEAITDDSDLDEIYDTERHLLYVACTRARDHLLISCGGVGSEFLEDMV